jgi:hypothetical protein
MAKSTLAQLLETLGAADEIKKMPTPQAEVLTIFYDWLHNLEERLSKLEKK